MGKYEVIHFFTDLQDFGHPYHPGDVFPRAGIKVSEVRIQELSGSNNKQHKPLIKPMKNEEPSFSDSEIEFEETPPVSYTKTEINRMSKAELQELARNTGVNGVEDMTGAELKEYLHSIFGL